MNRWQRKALVAILGILGISAIIAGVIFSIFGCDLNTKCSSASERAHEAEKEADACLEKAGCDYANASATENAETEKARRVWAEEGALLAGGLPLTGFGLAGVAGFLHIFRPRGGEE